MPQQHAVQVRFTNEKSRVARVVGGTVKTLKNGEVVVQCKAPEMENGSITAGISINGIDFSNQLAEVMSKRARGSQHILRFPEHDTELAQWEENSCEKPAFVAHSAFTITQILPRCGAIWGGTHASQLSSYSSSFEQNSTYITKLTHYIVPSWLRQVTIFGGNSNFFASDEIVVRFTPVASEGIEIPKSVEYIDVEGKFNARLGVIECDSVSLRLFIGQQLLFASKASTFSSSTTMCSIAFKQLITALFALLIDSHPLIRPAPLLFRYHST